MKIYIVKMQVIQQATEALPTIQKHAQMFRDSSMIIQILTENLQVSQRKC